MVQEPGTRYLAAPEASKQPLLTPSQMSTASAHFTRETRQTNYRDKARRVVCWSCSLQRVARSNGRVPGGSLMMWSKGRREAVWQAAGCGLSTREGERDAHTPPPRDGCVLRGLWRCLCCPEGGERKVVFTLTNGSHRIPMKLMLRGIRWECVEAYALWRCADDFVAVITYGRGRRCSFWLMDNRGSRWHCDEVSTVKCTEV